MNVDKGVEFGHLFRLNDVTADSHYPKDRVKKTIILKLMILLKRPCISHCGKGGVTAAYTKS